VEEWRRLPEEPGVKFTWYVRKDGRITVPKEVMNALASRKATSWSSPSER